MHIMMNAVKICTVWTETSKKYIQQCSRYVMCTVKRGQYTVKKA